MEREATKFLSKTRIIKNGASETKTVKSYIDSMYEFKSKEVADSSNDFTETVSEDTKLKAIEREAYEHGFEQGEKAGRILGEQKLEPVVKSLSSLLSNLSSPHEQWLKDKERTIIELALIIATKVIHGELTQNQEVVLRIAHEVINRTIKGARTTLRVSPQDLSHLEQHLKNFSDYTRSKHFTIEADSDITRGGCILISDAGEIDATIENQICMMKEKLISEIE